MRDHSIPGLALGIARDGRPLYLRGFGSAHPGRPARVTPRTIFAIGSLTKSFTAALALRLIDEGKLRLTTALPGARKATLGEALAMAAGLPDYSELPNFSAQRREPIAASQLYAAALSAPLAFSPGTGAGYSNTDYLAIALAIERATRASFGALIQRDLLRRYRLHSTAVAWPAFAAAATHASSTMLGGSPTLGFATADLESNLPDLLRWYGLLFDGRVVPGRLLARTLPPTQVSAQFTSRYGDGFTATRFFGRSALLVRGFVAGFSSVEVYVRRERLDVVILTNADRVDLAPLASSVIARTLDIRDPLY